MLHETVAEDTDTDTPIQLPTGWRFMPTDEELVVSYLSNKVAVRSLPTGIITEIDASEFYSKHPRDLGCPQHGSYRYFFVHHDKYFHGIVQKNHPVGDGNGFWRFAGKEEPICDGESNILAFKIHSTFFTTNPAMRKTDWNMEKYRVTDINMGTEKLPREEWVVAKIRSGKTRE